MAVWPLAEVGRGASRRSDPPSHPRAEDRWAGCGICRVRIGQSLGRSGKQYNSTRRTCAAARVDETSCRMLRCARCRSQVLICRRCDRGQIYCIETCAQEARRDRQKEARQRCQATPRGRAMHADRNRHYRARRQRVTDHGLSMAHQVGLSPGLVVETAPSSGMSSEHRRCHHCGHPASAYLRLSALRGRHRGKRRAAGAVDLAVPPEAVRQLPVAATHPLRPRMIRESCPDCCRSALRTRRHSPIRRQKNADLRRR